MFTYKSYVFYTFVCICLIGVVLSTPFLRYPYDMIHHLIVIDEWYILLGNPIEKFVGIWANDIYIVLPSGGKEYVTMPNGREIWHYIWAKVFFLLGMDSSQMFLRAKIIHIFQTFIAIGSVYYFAKVVIRNFFKKIEDVSVKWLAFWSVLIWLVIFSTASMYYHQVWMMWYSVNYQITLPLFWYITALTLVLLLEDASWRVKLFFVIQILLLSRFILQAHSMEFMYYLMYVWVFSLVYLDKIFEIFKKYFYLLIPLVLFITFFLKSYQPDNSKIFNYMSIDKLPELYKTIIHEGEILISGYNRSASTVNELMYFIGFMGVAFLMSVVWRRYKHKENVICGRMVLFTGLTSLFIFIPLYPPTAGFFAVVTSTGVVNRLYYSSSLFVLLPIIMYYFAQINEVKFKYVHVGIVVSLVLVTVFSKHTSYVNHNYYKNIKSIKSSFNERKVGFNLSANNIQTIGDKLKEYEKNNTKRTIYYYARADIAFVLKYIYKRKVHWEGRRANPNYVKLYKNNKNNNRDYCQILFEVPEGFPAYKPYL